MTLPEDRLQEAERAIKNGTNRERRILERIRRAVRSLQDVRRKLARDRRAHAAALDELRTAPADTPAPRRCECESLGCLTNARTSFHHPGGCSGEAVAARHAFGHRAHLCLACAAAFDDRDKRGVRGFG